MLSTISQILHNNDMYAINAQKIMDLEQFMLIAILSNGAHVRRFSENAKCASSEDFTPPEKTLNNKKESIFQQSQPPLPPSPIMSTIVCEKKDSQNNNPNAIEIKENTTTPTQSEVQKTKQPEIITPTQSNTLFWSTFIGVYGYGEYMKIGSKYNNAEIEEKQHIMEELSKTPKKLKETNQTITNAMVQELFSSLMVNKYDQLFSLVAFSVYYNRAIYVLFSNKSYLVFEPNKHTQNTNAIIIHTKVGARSNIYSIELEHENDRLDFIRSNYVLLESYNKPLKGLSSYKVADLEKMATILGLDTSMKKGDLYNKIAEICSLEKVMINSK